MEITTVLLDLDGVIRHFDPDHVASIERAHSLPIGTLTNTAFEPELLERVITGRLSRSLWVEEVGTRTGSPSAAVEWMAEQGSVDEEMLAEVDALRSVGVAVAVLTNGTDTIPDEMASLGLDIRFDAIFNSAEIGFAKPDRRVFEHACRELDASPGSVFFSDDSTSKLQGAIELGMTVRLFEGVQTFRRQLDEVGLRAR